MCSRYHQSALCTLFAISPVSTMYTSRYHQSALCTLSDITSQHYVHSVRDITSQHYVNCSRYHQSTLCTLCSRYHQSALCTLCSWLHRSKHVAIQRQLYIQDVQEMFYRGYVHVSGNTILCTPTHPPAESTDE